VSTPTSGLARLTIRAPRRSLDLAIPDHVPLAELLPEVLRRAGEAGASLGAYGPTAYDPTGAYVPERGRGLVPAGGWALRRGEGTLLRADLALAAQSVRDGDVLYLVPRQVAWPEPAYDDVVEEVAATARERGRAWDATATRTFALVAAGLLLLTGLGLLLAVGPPRTLSAVAAAGVAGTLLVVGALLSRAAGDGVAGAAAGGMALPYATAAGGLFAAGPGPLAATEVVLVGACALLLASALGSISIGYGLRIFAAGGALGLAGLIGAVLAFSVPAHRAAAILVVVLVAGIAAAPALAVRLSRLPLPAVTASPQLLAAEPRPARDDVVAAVVRGDELLIGSLTGISIAAAGCVALLAAAGGVAAPLLGGLAAATLLLRARLLPAVAARLPLLISGLVGLALTSAAAAAAAGSATRLAGVALACAAVVALLATAATSARRRGAPSPYLGRMADILDVVTVVALAPVACAVLDLFSWVRGLSG